MGGKFATKGVAAAKQRPSIPIALQPSFSTSRSALPVLGRLRELGFNLKVNLCRGAELGYLLAI